ncbi:hypothetical protein [Bacillus sp. FJAT-47783]|uniref:hypothetical protein n=1 Tax=Bacillus sp. FJAT-47783 TaxID=2922712 RepID=UPI001FADFC76|nr:hypothetical protein [Bacillus sp. FJAT-47783]
MKYEFKDEDELLSFLKENVLTRREAEAYLDISKQSFSRSLKKGKFHYFKAIGEGKGQVQLFLKHHLDPYRQELLTELKKYNPHVAKNEGEDKM